MPRTLSDPYGNGKLPSTGVVKVPKTALTSAQKQNTIMAPITADHRLLPGVSKPTRQVTGGGSYIDPMNDKRFNTPVTTSPGNAAATVQNKNRTIYQPTTYETKDGTKTITPYDLGHQAGIGDQKLAEINAGRDNNNPVQGEHDAWSKWQNGEISQSEYESQVQDIRSGLTPGNTGIDTITDLRSQINDLSKPTGDDGPAGIKYTTEQKAALDAENALKKSALEGALQKEQDRQKSSFTTSRAAAVEARKQNRIQTSRENAVKDLVHQGVTDPAQLLDYLNKHQDGTVVGDFTPDEIQSILAKTGAGTAATPAAPRVSTTSAALDAVIASSDPLTQGYLLNAKAILAARQGNAQDEYLSDTELADKEFADLQSVTGDMLSRANSMSQLTMQIAKQTVDSNDQLAKMQKDQAIRQNEYERQVAQYTANKEKRDLQLSNKKRVDNLANRIAVAGGFGSMNNLAEVDRVQFEGDQAVADLVMQATFMDQSFVNKAFDIENSYTNLITQNHQSYSSSLREIVSKYNDRVDEIQNLLRGGAEKRNQEYRTARKTLRSEWLDLQDKHLSLLKDGIDHITARADKLRQETDQKQQQNWQHAYSYISAFGTQNKEALGTFENALNLPAGTLSSVKTLAELRMKRVSGGGSTPDSTSNYVAGIRQQILRQYPQYANDPEKLDSIVLENTQTNYQGSKYQGFRVAVQNYVNDNNYGAHQTGWQWVGDGATYSPPKQYFLSYKFRPQFEFNQVQMGEDDLSSVISQWASSSSQ
ncbi:hypothetical protein KW797_00275 [Candidatus Parcubacteria bacterium]|nr:hypothetical protein [Candidatus Parcubacteria bacterium]